MKSIENYLFNICLFFLGVIIIVKVLSSIAISDFTSIEFPIHTINDIAQDDTGNIYVGLDSWTRIQVYDRFGNFKYGWQINNNGHGGWSFRIDDDNVIHLLSSLLYQQFSINGELLYTKRVKPEFLHTYRKLGTKREKNNCENIEIYKKWFLNFTVADKKTKKILIETPWYLALIDFPIPMIFYSIFFMYYIVRKISFDYKMKNKLIESINSKSVNK